MNTSVAADALDQGYTDRARTRVRTGWLVLYIASEPSRPPLLCVLPVIRSFSVIAKSFLVALNRIRVNRMRFKYALTNAMGGSADADDLRGHDENDGAHEETPRRLDEYLAQLPAQRREVLVMKHVPTSEASSGKAGPRSWEFATR